MSINCGQLSAILYYFSGLIFKSMKKTLFTLIISLCSFLHSQTIKQKLTEHTRKVESVCYSNNGKILATGSWDGNILIYTIDSTGNYIVNKTLSGHLGAVTNLWFYKNNRYLVSCSKDFSVKIWNIDTPELVKTFNQHLEVVSAAFLDPSGKTLITASYDGNIKTTNLIDAKKNKTIKVGLPIYDLVLSRDNKFYYAAVKGGIIKKIETGSTKTVADITGHLDDINSLDLSPDGKFLASGSSDKTIIIWDLSTLKESKKMTGFEWKVTSVKYNADGKYIAGSCNNGISKLFSIETGKLITDFGSLNNNSRDLSFNNNSKHIAIATHYIESTSNFGATIFNTGIETTVAIPASNNPKKTTTPTKPKPKK